MTLRAILDVLAAYTYRLDDPIDQWLGTDKLEHIGWAGFLWAVLWAHITWAPLAIGLFLAAAIGIEVVEVIRYRAWVARGMPRPWPWLTDKASVKDFLADCVGAVLCQLLVGGRL